MSYLLDLLKRFVSIHPTATAFLAVLLLLVCSFVGAGFVSSAYRGKRASLGEHHYMWGQWNFSHGHPDMAVSDFRKALLYLPDNLQYRLSLSQALLAVGNLNEAHSRLVQLAEEYPTNGLINLMLARVDRRQKHPLEALQYYQRAVYEYWPKPELPQRRKARWELVSLLGQLGDHNSEIAELMQLYASAPKDPEERSKIGFLLLKNGAASEALRVFQALRHASPHDSNAYRGLGQIAFDSGNYDHARRNFERAVRLDPKDAESLQALNLTNTVVDLDPALPRISGAERRRRSKNLLNRVLSEIEECAEGRQIPATIVPTIASATQLLSVQRLPKGDVTLQREDVAQQLWKVRAQLCGGPAVQDQAVEIVLQRIGS
ncbi:MAG TPA: tetratricopeptide repeat protein [Bryobacteraceae bacterium]